MNWLICVLLFLFMGLVFLLIEIFILPGFGPVGILAALFLLAGAYLAWWKLSVAVAIVVTLSSILSVILSVIFIKKSGLSHRFVLDNRVLDKPLTQDKEKRGLNLSVGDIGLTACDLRPAGIAEIKNQRVNVITDGTYITKNTQVRVSRVEGNKIFVEKEKQYSL